MQKQYIILARNNGLNKLKVDTCVQNLEEIDKILLLKTKRNISSIFNHLKSTTQDKQNSKEQILKSNKKGIKNLSKTSQNYPIKISNLLENLLTENNKQQLFNILKDAKKEFDDKDHIFVLMNKIIEVYFELSANLLNYAIFVEDVELKNKIESYNSYAINNINFLNELILKKKQNNKGFLNEWYTFLNMWIETELENNGIYMEFDKSMNSPIDVSIIKKNKETIKIDIKYIGKGKENAHFLENSKIEKYSEEEMVRSIVGKLKKNDILLFSVIKNNEIKYISLRTHNIIQKLKDKEYDIERRENKQHKNKKLITVDVDDINICFQTIKASRKGEAIKVHISNMKEIKDEKFIDKFKIIQRIF